MRPQLPALTTLLLALALTLTTPAHALTVSIPITPDSLKQDPRNQPFKVTVEKRADGLTQSGGQRANTCFDLRSDGADLPDSPDVFCKRDFIRA